jgi:ubiquinone/menaquinone biosynthesis C-methylase UbiE
MIRLLYNVRDKLNEITIKSHIAANFLTLDLEKEQELTASLKTNYLANLSSDPDYVDSDVGQQDLKDHLFGRLWDDRRTVVPWLDSLRPLRGASILEVGCGPGASTVALAEQGALVIGVEIDANNLTVAYDRCRLYGLQNPQFHVMNGAEIDCLELERFDFIIFSACLEHMTLQERFSALRPAWSRLKPGGFLIVIETPNRCGGTIRTPRCCPFSIGCRMILPSNTPRAAVGDTSTGYIILPSMSRCGSTSVVGAEEQAIMNSS